MIGKKLYWFIQLTWGIVTTILGFLLTLILKIGGCKSYKNGYGLITTVGGNWGGLSLGPFAFCGRYNEIDGKCYDLSWYQHTRMHEFGHSIQVLIFGPFFLLIVGLPSLIRYWYQVIAQKFGMIFTQTWYDSIWFEGTASRWGTRWISEIEKDWK